LTRREQRYKYARPAVEDREDWLTRALWTREDHPLLERILIGLVVVCFTIEATYQIWVHLARAAATAARAQGL
jgi:hypothetical protein